MTSYSSRYYTREELDARAKAWAKSEAPFIRAKRKIKALPTEEIQKLCLETKTRIVRRMDEQPDDFSDKALRVHNLDCALLDACVEELQVCRKAEVPSSAYLEEVRHRWAAAIAAKQAATSGSKTRTF